MATARTRSFPLSRLTRSCTHDVTQRRNIELLKVRFGEAPLQVCEVMLKDMTDSRRTDEHIQSQKSVRAIRMHSDVFSRYGHSWYCIQRYFHSIFGPRSNPAISNCPRNFVGVHPLAFFLGATADYLVASNRNTRKNLWPLSPIRGSAGFRILVRLMWSSPSKTAVSTPK
jgi:hypothetical protein